MAKNSGINRPFAFLRDSLRESLFRNVGMPYRNLIGLFLGATASLLPLTSGTLRTDQVAWIFVISLLLTVALLVLARPNILNEYTKAMDRFAWGLLVIIIVGFGLGALIYQTRSWWVWLWLQYLKINNPAAILLEALFLLGVMLGFFVVRNWAKEQKDFITSLSGILSGAFVATVLGDIQKELTPMRAFAYYALGFTLSGTLNLIAAARLSAHYTNKRSIASRAMLDFLYGSERARTIDGYFLKNFQDDVDFAKLRLTETLIEYRELVRRELARKLNARMISRVSDREIDTNQPQQCTELKQRLSDEGKLREELKSMSLTKSDVSLDAAKQETQDQLNRVRQDISDLKSRLTPSYFYEMFAIECPEKPDSPSAIQDLDRPYGVIYKEVSSSNKSRITEGMFRVGVAIRWQDSLEFIIAPGEYRGSFPYFGSVAGLSLIVRQTIIMNRDRTKQFRSKDYRDGICPRDIEQWRGLDEIDYLSYIAIPVVSRLGSSTENAIGVVNIDSRLFVTHCKLDGQPVEGSEGMFRIVLTPRQLNEFATNLYEQEDEDVKHIEKLTKLIVPVLELYSKCRVGAT